MCAFIFQIIYGIVGVITLGLSIGSLASDSWKENEKGITIGQVLPCDKSIEAAIDLTAGKCSIDFGYFNTLPISNQIIAVCLILAILMEVVCIAYNIFTAFACCCKAALLKILLALSVIVFIFLLVVVGTAGYANKSNFQDLGKLKEVPTDDALKGKIGSSFVMIVVAMVFALGNIIVAVVAGCCAK